MKQGLSLGITNLDLGRRWDFVYIRIEVASAFSNK